MCRYIIHDSNTDNSELTRGEQLQWDRHHLHLRRFHCWSWHLSADIILPWCRQPCLEHRSSCMPRPYDKYHNVKLWRSWLQWRSRSRRLHLHVVGIDWWCRRFAQSCLQYHFHAEWALWPTHKPNKPRLHRPNLRCWGSRHKLLDSRLHSWAFILPGRLHLPSWDDFHWW